MITDPADLPAPSAFSSSSSSSSSGSFGDADSLADTDSLTDAAEHILPAAAGFAELALPEPILRAVIDKGYEQPTPIQRLAIPLLLQGRDVIGQAQTGTGKTAAFSLPLLQRIDPQLHAVQALVLVPTRELALQVATAVHAYAQNLPRVSVLPVFGGDSMERQISRLGRGVHVVVGTPGRILDHLRRGSLDLSQVRFLVLDEADEMLRMGFLEDVEAILEKTPSERQTTLLSATMPPAIRRIARHHLREPEHVVIEAQTITVENTDQRVAIVPENLKLEAVARLLESEEPEATLIFTRTRIGAAELAEQLTARGFPAESLHSDLSQTQRLAVLSRLRARRAQVVVATDVAARGLDIDHISHVINYDLPGDAETYVHRIGRTGRAGRAGVALLLATPYQRPVLRTIERFTQRPLTLLTLPTAGDVAQRRRQRIQAALIPETQKDDLASYRTLCSEIAAAAEREPLDIAAAALRLLTAERPLFVDAKAYDPLARLAQTERTRPEPGRNAGKREFGAGARSAHGPGAAPQRAHASSSRWEGPRAQAGASAGSADRARIVLAVGHSHGIRPGDIVGAIANEAGLSGRDIGRVEIHDHESVAEIPAAALSQVLTSMRNATVRGQAAQPRVFSASGSERAPRRSFSDSPPGFDRERPPRRPFSDSAQSPGHDRPQRRSFADAPHGAESERPQRRSFADPSASSGHDRPQRRSFSDAPQSSGYDRPQRRSFSDSPSSSGHDRPQRRSFSDSPASSGHDRPQRRSFSDAPSGSGYDRPQRRSFSDSGSEAERDRSRAEAQPRRDHGTPAYNRAPARERSPAGSWTWGKSAPPVHGRSDDYPPSTDRHGKHPPKRRPR